MYSNFALWMADTHARLEPSPKIVGLLLGGALYYRFSPNGGGTGPLSDAMNSAQLEGPEPEAVTEQPLAAAHR